MSFNQKKIDHNNDDHDNDDYDTDNDYAYNSEECFLAYLVIDADRWPLKLVIVREKYSFSLVNNIDRWLPFV